VLESSNLQLISVQRNCKRETSPVLDLF
jgi:hypothetical protein